MLYSRKLLISNKTVFRNIFRCPLANYYFFLILCEALASTASFFRGSVFSTGAFTLPVGNLGARGGVEKDDFRMLSGFPAAPGARNAISGHVPTSPGSLRRRLARFPGGNAVSGFCPRSFEGGGCRVCRAAPISGFGAGYPPTRPRNPG